MTITIYRGEDILTNVSIDTGSQHSKQLNGEDVCKISFAITEVIDFQIGDYILIFGRQFNLNIIPSVTKRGENNYLYDCIFESIQYDLSKIQYTNLINGEFPLTGDLSVFVNLIITNLNRVYTGWSTGVVKIGTETKTLQFSNENCLEVLQRLCTEYSVNFKISESKSISIDNFTSAPLASFSYGKGVGLWQLNRTVVDSKNIITRLYPYGSTRNIPSDYRNYSTRLKLAESYIESNVELYGIMEASQTFEDIKPRFNGVITEVSPTDETIFKCSSIDFNLNNQLMPGTSAKVHFNTGLLAGYEFEISSYNDITKEISLKVLDQEKAINGSGLIENYVLPNDTLKPEDGNQFVFIDIIMPQSYITEAETALREAATSYINQNNHPRVQYKLDLDAIFMKEAALTPDVGDYITVVDAALGINSAIQITGYQRDLYFEGAKWVLDLDESLSPQLSTRLIADIADLKRLAIVNRLTDIARAMRNWKNIDELYNAVFDPDGYFDVDRIKPLSIETSMLSVGSKSGQFTLSSLIEPNYTSDPALCKLGAGQLVHFTIEETPRTWYLSENNYTSLVAGSFYYIYARCTRSTANSGTLILDTVQRTVESDPTYFYFLVGVLNSVVDGIRGVMLTYGQTAINGRFVKTGRVQSVDGLTWFDLDLGEIHGKVVFTSGSSGFENALQLSGRNLVRNSDYRFGAQYWGAITIYIEYDIKYVQLNFGWENRQAIFFENGKTYAISFMARNNSQDALNVGLVFENNDTFAYAALPAYSGWTRYKTTFVYNYPSAEQMVYVYIMAEGYDDDIDFTQLKIEEANICSEWSPAPEDDLQGINTSQSAANTAIALANTKTKNFNVTPYTPYLIGDTWTNGSDLYTCIVSRPSGAFVSGDWAKRTVYDSTQVAIDNGIVSAGSIRVKDIYGNEWGGMRGGGTGTDVGWWLGASYANRNSAPLRGYHDGTLIASKGNIAGWTITSNRLAKDTGVAATSSGMAPDDYPFYAGATYANRANAKFWIKPTGEGYFSKVTLNSSENANHIEISASTNKLTLYSGNGGTLILEADSVLTPSITLDRGNSTTHAYLMPGVFGIEKYYTNNLFYVYAADTYLDVRMKNLPTTAQVGGSPNWKYLWYDTNSGIIARNP